MIDQLRQLPSWQRNLTATVFLVGACAIASLTYTKSFLWVFTREVSFIPDLASGLIAILLIIPVVRGDFLFSHKLDKHTMMNLVLIFYLTAAFTTIGLGAGTVVMKGPTFIFAAIVIALANYSPSKYGELAVIALAVFGGVNVLSASSAMGFFGFLLVLFSAVGVLFAVDLKKFAYSLSGKRA